MRGSIRKNIKKILTVLLSLAMISACMVPSFAAIQFDKLIPVQGKPNSRRKYQVATAQQPAAVQGQTEEQNTNQPAPTSSTMKVMISGIYDSFDRSSIVDQINAIRKQAYEEKLVSEYVPVQWSSDLEAIARQRAVEAIMSASHTRPDGSAWYTAESGGIQPDAEDLAWGKTVSEAFPYWTSGKEEYQQTGANNDNTSNYLILINPDYKYIGFSSFAVGEGTVRRASALELSSGNDLRVGANGSFGTDSVDVNVLRRNVTYHFSGPSSTAVGKRVRFDVVGYYSEAESADAYNGTFTVSLKDDPVWNSSNQSVGTISSDGIFTAVAPGTTTVTAQINGKTVGKNVTVK